jgi:predicted DNA-binding antitoxin AbrB/MazE fold protein
MVQITEAVFSDGVLKPVGEVHLREQQRVRVIIEPMDGGAQSDRDEAIRRLKAGIERMNFRSKEPLPSRDDLQSRLTRTS